MDKKKAKLDFKPITADDIERLTPFFSEFNAALRRQVRR